MVHDSGIAQAVGNMAKEIKRRDTNRIHSPMPFVVPVPILLLIFVARWAARGDDGDCL